MKKNSNKETMINRTDESKLYKVLKVKIRDSYCHRKVKVNEIRLMNKCWNIKRIQKPYLYISGIKKFCIDIDLDNKSELRKMYTLVKESELIRIIRCLELENNNKLHNGFILINDIITVDISTKIYEKNELGIIYLRKIQKVDNGNKKVVSTIKYKRLLASTGGIRSKRVTFIKEDLFDKANEILLCGMANNMEYEFFSKYSSYYALASTDSDVVTMPRIVVVKDYKYTITDTFDVVTEKFMEGKDRIHKKTGKPLNDKHTGEIKKEQDKFEYEIELNCENHEEIIKPFDGAGLIDINLGRIWKKELKLDYMPSSFQIRAIPGLKGNLYLADIQSFVKNNFPNKKTIKDAWNNNVDLYDKDENFAIDVILTVSQFKFFKEYKSFKDWLTAFNTETHGYKRTFNICSVGDKYGKLKDKVLLSYQPLQSLNLDKDQIQLLCQDTVDIIKEISTNVDSFLKYRGYNEDDPQIPDYYKSMAINKELFYDPWIQSKVKRDIEGFKEKSYRGGLFVPGNYQVLIPDIYSLAMFALSEEPAGLLKKDEVYSNYWFNKKVEKINIIRFPHIAMEHGLVNVVNPKKNDRMNFYKYITTGIVTSMYSTLPLRLNSADFDGDKILSNCSSVLLKAVSEQMTNTITYLPDKSRNSEDKVKHRINEMSELISTDIKGMANNIGKVINKISILWSLPQDEITKKYIKIMSIIGSLTIDYVKTGDKTPIPKEISDYLKDKKLPEFMRTRYKSKDKKERVNLKEAIVLSSGKVNEEDFKLFGHTDCTMNRICSHMRDEVEHIKLDKQQPDYDFLTSMTDQKIYEYNETYPRIRELLKEMKQESDDIAKLKVLDENGDSDIDKIKEKDYMYITFYEYCRNTLLALCGGKNKMNKNKLIDYLIYAFFCDKDFALKHQDKAILWNCFGKELTTRFKGKIRKVNPYDDDQLAKLADKATQIQTQREDQKKKRRAKNKKFARIPMFQGKEVGVKIYKDEILHIKNTILDLEAVKLGIGLLVLDRFCKAYNIEFRIYTDKKLVINKNQLVILTDINVRHYDKLRSILLQKGIIGLTPKSKTDYGYVKCVLNKIEITQEEFIELKDINDIDKILKNINKLDKIFNKLLLTSNLI